MEDKTMWNYIQYLYKKYHNIPPSLVDKMAAVGILELCANGFPNEKISFLCELPVDYVTEIIKQYFHFEGWNEELDIVPYSLYYTMGKDYNTYVREVNNLSRMMKLSEVRKSFGICSILDRIKKEIKGKVK